MPERMKSVGALNIVFKRIHIEESVDVRETHSLSDLEPVMRASKRTFREGKVRKISCASRSHTLTSPHRVDVLASSRHLKRG